MYLLSLLFLFLLLLLFVCFYLLFLLYFWRICSIRRKKCENSTNYGKEAAFVIDLIGYLWSRRGFFRQMKQIYYRRKTEFFFNFFSDFF